MSNKLKLIEEYLRRRNAKYVTNVTLLNVPPMLLLTIPVECIREKIGPNWTSMRQIRNLALAIESEFAISVRTLISRGEQTSVLERGIERALQHAFPGKFSKAYLSTTGAAGADLLLVAADSSQVVKPTEIEQVASAFLAFSGVKLGALSQAAVRFGEPSLAIVLRQLKRIAPATEVDLAQELASKMYSLSTDTTLSAKLDQLRKRNLIVRSPNGYFSLTSAGLKSVPHGSHSQSSDVERALYFGRREW